jgi:hypothetical protein
MSSPLHSWLAALPAFNGLLGAYIADQHQTPDARSWSERYSPDALCALHRQVCDVIEVLAAGDLPARKLRWIFDQSVVYYERRPDGVGLCLITTHDPWTGDSDTITQIIHQFRNAA